MNLQDNPFKLNPKPSTESLRNKLNQIYLNSNKKNKNNKYNIKIKKNTKDLFKIKPQILKQQEIEIKKILHQNQLHQHLQQDNLHHLPFYPHDLFSLNLKNHSFIKKKFNFHLFSSKTNHSNSELSSSTSSSSHSNSNLNNHNHNNLLNSESKKNLTIVTLGMNHAEHKNSFDSIHLLPSQSKPMNYISPVICSTPITCLDNSIMNSQQRMTPFDLLIDNQNKKKINLNQIQSNIFIKHQVQNSIPFLNSPLELDSHQDENSLHLFNSNLTRFDLNNSLNLFNNVQNSNEILLVTDVLIEQQGGLNFLGHENFNERFRTKPWKTIKILYQYDKPGSIDAEYLPDLFHSKVVQTPHSPKTFPLPTPEWYWVTDFSIDLQSRPVDSNGWEYYNLFNRKWSSRSHPFQTYVRRRWWIRVRAKLKDSNPDLTQSIHTSNSFQNLNHESNTLIVKLIKIGTQDSISFNSFHLQGGHSLKIHLPHHFPSIQFHWDDSSLIPQNPIFSSQNFLNHLSNQSLLQIDHLHHQDIIELIQIQLAQINFQRISNSFRGLSEPQKIKLWKFWLEPKDTFNPSISTHPDPKDVWKIIDCHFEQVLDLFCFDTSRVKFLHLIFTFQSRSFFNRNSNSSRSNSHTTPEKVLKTNLQVQDINHNSSTDHNIKIKDIHFNQIQLDFWSNFLNTIQFKNNQHVLQDFNNDHVIFLKYSISVDLRNYLSKFIKSQNKSRRLTSIPK